MIEPSGPWRFVRMAARSRPRARTESCVCGTGRAARPFAGWRGTMQKVWSVRFSPDGQRLASSSFDRTIRIWRAGDGAPIQVLRGHTQAVVGLAYSPDGSVIASGGDDSTIREWRARIME